MCKSFRGITRLKKILSLVISWSSLYYHKIQLIVLRKKKKCIESHVRGRKWKYWKVHKDWSFHYLREDWQICLGSRPFRFQDKKENYIDKHIATSRCGTSWRLWWHNLAPTQSLSSFPDSPPHALKVLWLIEIGLCLLHLHYEHVHLLHQLLPLLILVGPPNKSIRQIKFEPYVHQNVHCLGHLGVTLVVMVSLVCLSNCAAMP